MVDEICKPEVPVTGVAVLAAPSMTTTGELICQILLVTGFASNVPRVGSAILAPRAFVDPSSTCTQSAAGLVLYAVA